MSDDDLRRSWLTGIYQRHADDVYNVLRWRLRPFGLMAAADDLMQDVFVTAFDKCDQLIVHPDIRRWLFATTDFKVRNFIRKLASEQRRILWDSDAAQHYDAPDPSAESALARVLEERVDCEDILQRVKQVMTDSDRLLYRQAYEDKVSPAQLSAAYGITEAAMRMRISRLRKRILLSVKNFLYLALLCTLTDIF